MTLPEAGAHSRIPTFGTCQEEAEFWDTHDSTDVADEFEPVQARFTKNLSERLAIRLDQEPLTKLRQKAHEKGIAPTTLARLWLAERMHAEGL